jgi:spore germination protein Q
MYWYYPAPAQNHLQPQNHLQQQVNVTQQRTERVFSEDLLQRNVGRKVTVYSTYENNNKWNAQVITGKLKEVGRDFILVTNQETGKDVLLLNIHTDYIVFD